MKLSCIMITLMSFFSLFSMTYAVELENTSTVEIETNPILELQYEKNIYLGNVFSLDITEIGEDLSESLGGIELIYEWDIKGRSSKTGPILNETFEKTGIKEITLNVFRNDTENKTLYLSSQLNVFVYDSSIPAIISKQISQSTLEDLQTRSNESGVLLSPLKIISESDIPDMNIKDALDDFLKDYEGNSNYLIVWGEKEFLFSVIGKLNQEFENTKDTRSINFVLLSGFNGNILQGYLSNLISNKRYIKKTLLLDESLAFQILKYPKIIKDLEKNLANNEFEFNSVNTDSVIPSYFFISNFINNLSGKGITTSDIYIILMIPLLLTLISFIKHFVGLSPIGIVLPLFFSLLAFKLGLIFFVTTVAITFFLNILIGYAVSKSNLLYTPKITFLTIINILFFILFFSVASSYELVSLSPTSAIYIVIYIIVAEKLIHVVVSKEFREYKKSLYATFIIGMFGFGILHIDGLRVLLLAYPELLLILVPLNFLIGKFTGLRVTEYLRFREVIKNVEE